MLNRRAFLAGGAGATVVVAAAVHVSSGGGTGETEVSLRELGRSKGIEIGSAFSGSKRKKYRALLSRHCEVLTPEWQLKPAFLKPSDKAPYRFEETDSIAEFCAANDQKLHGHTLFWYRQAIRWAESGDLTTVKHLYGGFIRDVVTHYPQAVSWDVFNEIVEEKTVFRDDFLIGKFGYEFIDFCFRTAEEAAPGARLVINDYNLECAGAWCGSKQENMLAVLEKLKAMKTPVHVVGIQGHLSSKYPPSAKSTLQFIRRIADLGCDVYLSEVDVNDSEFADNVEERDAEVARYYEDFLTTVLDDKAVKRLLFWSISDYDNWIVRGQTDERRKTGAARPGLFDARNDPKPAFDAVVRALEAAPVRP